MKSLLLLTVCLSASAYEFLEGQKLDTTLNYSCEDPVLEDSFLRMFAVWNRAAQNVFTINKSTGSAASVYVLLNPSLPVHIAGVTFSFGHFAMVTIRNRDFALDATMLHELGHALGLDHSTAPHSIMNAEIKYEATLVQDDVDGVCDLYGVSPVQYDFKLRQSGRRLIARSHIKADWCLYHSKNPTDVLKFELGHNAFHGRIGYGTFELEMTDRGISVYKTITY